MVSMSDSRLNDVQALVWTMVLSICGRGTIQQKTVRRGVGVACSGLAFHLWGGGGGGKQNFLVASCYKTEDLGSGS